MIKNFNWGHGITLFYIVFVGAVVTALVASFGVDHSLVVDDYYAKDLAYQSQYEKSQNAMSAEKLYIANDRVDGNISLAFASQGAVTGTAYLYRPSDQSQDFQVAIDGAATTFSTKSMTAGKWIMKIDWSEDGLPYYKEEVIVL